MSEGFRHSPNQWTNEWWCYYRTRRWRDCVFCGGLPFLSLEGKLLEVDTLVHYPLFLQMLNFLAEVSSVGLFDSIHSATYANDIFQHGCKPNTFHSPEYDPRGWCGFPHSIPGLSERAELDWKSWDNFSQIIYYLDFNCWFFDHIALGRSAAVLNEPGSAVIWLLLAASGCFTDITCALYRRFTVFNLSQREMGGRASRFRQVPSPDGGRWTTESGFEPGSVGLPNLFTFHCADMITGPKEGKC